MAQTHQKVISENVKYGLDDARFPGQGRGERIGQLYRKTIQTSGMEEDKFVRAFIDYLLRRLPEAETEMLLKGFLTRGTTR